MRLLLHKHFKKQYKKLTAVQNKVDERLGLFLADPFDPLLNNHALSGKYVDCRSINISGDYRAIYQLLDDDVAYFITLDKHSNLYH
ncbi:type II toxin-antitoxin system RelE/ParE family toxin [Candidatus Uhrbacteria bacterium]|nr:type II toxin-antitoxin system RelE/ParE family toxin [Candidatus Uhrbacteria bacterium]